jgi:hypothetical protein
MYSPVSAAQFYHGDEQNDFPQNVNDPSEYLNPIPHLGGAYSTIDRALSIPNSHFGKSPLPWSAGTAGSMGFRASYSPPDLTPPAAIGYAEQYLQ